MADDLLGAAAKYLPGGSTWMWSLPADVRFVVERGEGSHIVDTNGKRYVDYVLGSGPLLLGHAPPAIVAAVQAQVAKGSHFHWLSEPTIRLAARLVEAVPCASSVRFVSTGTEATMLAIRMARVFTHREKVLKLQPVFVDPTRAIRSERDLADADGKRAVRLGHELVRRGVFVIPGAKMYLSLAHTDADLALTVEAFDESLAAVHEESAAPNRAGARGASRRRRDAPSAGGSGGHVGAPS